MTIALNSYASKAFSEHPIASWPLDDDIYFISQINDSERLISNWETPVNFTSNNSPSLVGIDLPFKNETYSAIVVNSGISSSTTITAKSSSMFDISLFENTLKNFCINLYLYQNPTRVVWFKFGYEYYNSVTESWYQILSDEIAPPTSASWINFNKTYDIPQNATSAKIIIQIRVSGGGDDSLSARTFILNGLSVGQWSETVCNKSLGALKQELPSGTGLVGLYGVPSKQYGITGNDCYFIVEDDKLLARNEGPPLIFGTDNATRIYNSTSGNPSIIFPSKGFMTNSGKYNNYSLEFWMQIKPQASGSRKIFGPISDDSWGVYVKEGFISLVIGDEIGSFSVSEWYRPMLIHVSLKDKNATLMINGEQVVSIPYERSSLTFPSTEWLGLYSYSDIDIFKFDCISIYPYIVSEQLAKKRFVWGQGTPSVQFLDKGFSGTPTTIDYSTSKYPANIIYPDIYRWDSASYDNFIANKNFLSVPNYSLPQVYLSERSLSEWYEENLVAYDTDYPDGLHSRFITFRPDRVSDTNWTEQCYLNFPSLDIITNQATAFYGVFEIEDLIDSERPLIHFVNTLKNNERFTVNIKNDTIIYKLNDELIHEEIIDVGNHFAAGLNFQLVSDAFGYNVSSFFSSPGSIQVFIGGDATTTFEGKIYRVGVSNQSSFVKISSGFNDDGIAKYDSDSLFIDYFASYTLLPIYEYGQLFLDIATYSQWEEYYPLSSFASYVNDEVGDSIYDIDYLQINVGYPTVISPFSFLYEELKENYLGKTYEDLADPLESGYENYYQLRINNGGAQNVDTSSSSLKMYLTFERVSDGANKPLDSFEYTKLLSEDMTIYADAENTVLIPDKAYRTKFEFKDGTIVYPPKDYIDFNEIAIVLHLELNQKGIISGPVVIKNLEISSNVLNADRLNTIGTKFGKNIYSFVKDVDGDHPKEHNPISIYKGATPYLYNTANSGIKVINNLVEGKEYGAYLTINESLGKDFQVGAIQLWTMYDYSIMPIEDMLIFEIDYLDSTIQFFIKADSSEKRGIITAKDKNDPARDMSFVNFYQNGIYINDAIIEMGVWNCLAVSFDGGLNFENYSGKITLFGRMIFNNISYYLTEGLRLKRDLNPRSWRQVYDFGSKIWSYWSSFEGGIWRDVYVLSESNSYSVSPINIYNSYVGINRNVIEDDARMVIQNTSFETITSAIWSGYIGKPA